MPERAPHAPKEVADPALRLVSTVRRRLLTSMAITATKVRQLAASLEQRPGSPDRPTLRHASRPVLKRSSFAARGSMRISTAISRRSMVRIEERPALNRARGAFIAQGEREHESKEPARTERLLANPLAL